MQTDSLSSITAFSALVSSIEQRASQPTENFGDKAHHYCKQPFQLVDTILSIQQYQA